MIILAAMVLVILVGFFLIEPHPLDVTLFGLWAITVLLFSALATVLM